jgi:myo-inositol-1(or 4)-monophosphatase
MVKKEQPSLDLVESWAKHAGSIARDRFLKEHDLGFKGATDLVTEVDHQCEDYLVKQILNAFPSHSILTEESGKLNSGSTERWYIDPLDGTINYAHRIPLYVISIAYESEGKLQLGVVYDPSRDECFTAERGRGAWLNKEPIRPSGVTDLEKSLHATAFARRDDELFDRNMRYYNHLTRATQGVRRMGCAALEACYVACGRVDAYWEQQINAWDVAAAALIVQEAGGIVTTPEGDPDYFKPPYAILASAPGIHRQLLDLFKSLR